MLVYDIEADGLYEQATKIHCICCIHDEKEYTFTDGDWPDKDGRLKDFLDLAYNTDTIICHNQVWYDLPMLAKFIGLEYKLGWKGNYINGRAVRIVDTLVESRWLWPDRPLPEMGLSKIKGKKVGAHGLEAWSYRVSGTKPKVEDWKEQPLHVYIGRCLEDVRNNKKVFWSLMDEMREYFGGENWKETRKNAKTVIRIENYFSHLFFLQGQRGIQFDIKKAESLVETMDKERHQLAAYVNPLLPAKNIVKSKLGKYKFPSEPRLKSGQFSRSFYKFLERNGASLDGEVVCWQGKRFSHPYPEYLTTKQPLIISDISGLKDYFLERGWIPTMYNCKKDGRGKPIKGKDGKPENTSPMMRDRMGNVCPNLSKMDDEIVKKILRYDAVSRRRAVIKSETKDNKGWLNHPRLKIDSRLPAEANTGGAGTGRVTHRVVANVPRVTSKCYGKECRELFTVKEGFYLLGYDASGLEARTEANQTFKFDCGVYAKELLEGDIHSKNAELWSTDRNTAKTTKYTLTYGASAPRVAATLGVGIEYGQEAYDAFWEAAPALKQAVEELSEEWEANGKKWLRGLDGRPIHTRYKHAIFSSRNQSSGAIVMKAAACIMGHWMEQYQECGRVLDYHDEEAWEIPKHYVKWKKVSSKEEGEKLQKEGYYSKPKEINGQWWVCYCKVGELGIKSIEAAGKFFNFKVPLTGEYQVGKTWADVH